LLLLASANRDEQVFANGEQFDIERENARTTFPLATASISAPAARSRSCNCKS
jgi:cytochrome P450